MGNNIQISCILVAMETLKDIVIIYHDRCRDGFGSAYAAWQKFGNTASYLPCKNQDPVPAGLTDKEIFILDYCYKQPDLEKLRNDNKSVVVIDHHKTSEATVTAYPENVFDMEHSGAVLSWQYFHPDTEVPKLLLYIEDHDLWHLQLPHTREFGAALGEYEQDFETWARLDDNLNDRDHFSKFISLGTTIARFEDRLVDKIVGDRELVEFEGHQVYAVNSELTYNSIVCNNLATLNGEEGRIEIGLAYQHTAGFVKCSLRSNGDVDVRKIAEKYGGGGHKNAAAMRFKSFDEVPFKFL